MSLVRPLGLLLPSARCFCSSSLLLNPAAATAQVKVKKERKKQTVKPKEDAEVKKPRKTRVSKAQSEEPKEPAAPRAPAAANKRILRSAREAGNPRYLPSSRKLPFEDSMLDTDVWPLHAPLAIRQRPQLRSLKVARKVVREWGVDKMPDGVTVLDILAGPGVITKALLELPNVHKVITIEDASRYEPFLSGIKARYPDRMELVKADGYDWLTYRALSDSGILDHIQKAPWKEEHPSLFVACQLMDNRFGDMFFSQLTSSAPAKLWLYKYGRFSTGFFGATTFWNKVLAPAGAPAHHKLSVLTSALASTQLSSQRLLPPRDYFHYARTETDIQYNALKATPREEWGFRDFECLEYVSKIMFSTRMADWKVAFEQTAVGVENLVPKVEAKARIGDKRVIDLTMKEWYEIANAFEQWPFRPKHLFTEKMYGDEERL